MKNKNWAEILVKGLITVGGTVGSILLASCIKSKEDLVIEESPVDVPFEEVETPEEEFEKEAEPED